MKKYNGTSSENKVRELVKPRKVDSALIREVEALCAELQCCNTLRRGCGTTSESVEGDDDILF